MWTPHELMYRHGIRTAVPPLSSLGVYFGDEELDCSPAFLCNEFSAVEAASYPPDDPNIACLFVKT